MTVSLAEAVDGFLEHKRAIGRKYHSEEAELRLLVRFATNRQVVGLNQVTPAVFDDFLASRLRFQPRSFNHLRGVGVCLLDWAVSRGLLETAPLHTSRRRVSATRSPFIFEPAQARRLLDGIGLTFAGASQASFAVPTFSNVPLSSSLASAPLVAPGSAPAGSMVVLFVEPPQPSLLALRDKLGGTAS